MDQMQNPLEKRFFLQISPWKIFATNQFKILLFFIVPGVQNYIYHAKLHSKCENNPFFTWTDFNSSYN